MKKVFELLTCYGFELRKNAKLLIKNKMARVKFYLSIKFYSSFVSV